MPRPAGDMMDMFRLIATGRVSSIEGWQTTSAGQRVYRFDMACNRRFGDSTSTIFLKCSVVCPEAHQVAERGLLIGETIWIDGTWATPLQNEKYQIIKVLVDGVGFISPMPQAGRLDRGEFVSRAGRVIPLDKTGTE